jgi:hypothetical protein
VGPRRKAIVSSSRWHAQQHGRDLVLVVDPANRAVTLALQAAGLAALFDVRADLEDALRPRV